ncbi:OLC1v1036526C1 [Oldenlandia corymbosa var. corymbosa]|uniref:OLC1v1036526C1 n=1 Tax=Oldenlandia corymbosa var. corymbosa TaxID=529605 RepID=A0AAV1CVM7_OLDCO|nr:OLC1v1036526C1 [Oldenlandia corymbosa var. corymbosa]
MGNKLQYQSAFLALAFLFATLISIADGTLVGNPLGSGSGRQQPKSQVIPIMNASGPESLAFDRLGGGPYTGVSDGRIIKWDVENNRWINFAVTTPHRWGCEGSHDHTLTEDRCGRPLGLSFNLRTGDLYIADAYMGLLVVGPQGGLAKPLATQAQGIPFKFANAVVVDHNSSVVYFTDTSTVFQRRDYVTALISGDKTGRLMKYDLRTKQVTVLMNNLMFPNGVALSKNKDYLLVVETTNSRILRYWLKKPMAGKVEVFAQLPGLPDNIQINHKGEFWVAMNAIKLTNLQGFLWVSKPPADFDGLGLAVKLNENGTIVQVLEDKEGNVWRYSSEVHEKLGSLWIGSVLVSFVARLAISGP